MLTKIGDDSDLTKGNTETKQPWWHSGKEFAYIVGHMGSIPEFGRSPGEGNGNPFHYSCLENLVDRGALQALVHGV